MIGTVIPPAGFSFAASRSDTLRLRWLTKNPKTGTAIIRASKRRSVQKSIVRWSFLARIGNFLGPVGSWRDTLDDEEVLKLLRKWNEEEQAQRRQ